jgi:transposase
MEQRIKFVGLDVHKETIAVAVAEDGADREVRSQGTVANTAEAVRRLVARLAAPEVELRFCHEAGPFGLGLYRQLRKLGAECLVIAPSTMPRRPGDRVKTDRRDAVTMARLLRAGELAGIWIPDEGHEAIRDLVRARRTAKDDLKRAKLGLSSFMLRHERRFGGRS